MAGHLSNCLDYVSIFIFYFRGIVFTHDVQMGGQPFRWREKVCPGCISETIRCRKLILGRDIGWAV